VRTVFGWVREDSPLYPDVVTVRSVLAGQPALRRALSRADEVHAELRASAEPTGLRTSRLYVVAQWREPGFRSLGYLAEGGRRQVVSLEDDPMLPQLRTPDAPWRSADDVLRYVPLRRLTFRAGGRVGKAKRASKLADSHARLTAVSRASSRAVRPVRVPEPGTLDRESGVFWQESLPGRPVVDTWDPDRMLAGLRAVGALNARIHRLPVPHGAELPRSADGGLPSSWPAQLAWIELALPYLAADLHRADTWLRVHAADLASPRKALCHGDFACSQVLAIGDDAAVVDWDLAVVGNPVAELATCLAGLPGDVPQLAAAPSDELADAERAYLDGYAEGAGEAVDHRRLRAWRLVAEVGELAKRLTKDRLDASALDRACSALRAVAEEGAA